MFADNYTPAQDLALRELISKLMAAYHITKLSGHNEYANKACPCFYVMEWYRAPLKARTSPKAGNSATMSPFAAFLTWLAKVFGGKA